MFEALIDKNNKINIGTAGHMTRLSTGYTYHCFLVVLICKINWCCSSVVLEGLFCVRVFIN